MIIFIVTILIYPFLHGRITLNSAFILQKSDDIVVKINIFRILLI